MIGRPARSSACSWRENSCNSLLLMFGEPPNQPTASAVFSIAGSIFSGVMPRPASVIAAISGELLSSVPVTGPPTVSRPLQL